MTLSFSFLISDTRVGSQNYEYFRNNILKVGIVVSFSLLSCVEVRLLQGKYRYLLSRRISVEYANIANYTDRQELRIKTSSKSPQKLLVVFSL